ncbi:hypothetical protein EII42_05735 [Tessaracoccus sp. OH4464_COT-324]|nr:hypothetical protein EII42_05735 [Tessaracoccus sp. OH4464_COT-324]
MITEDLRADSQHFKGLAEMANKISQCWSSLAAFPEFQGIWYGVGGPFTEASETLAKLFRSGHEEMERISEALNDSADHYDMQEDFGSERASLIGADHAAAGATEAMRAAAAASAAPKQARNDNSKGMTV